MVVDDDGTGLFSTGLRHGDAMHVSDWSRRGPASRCSASTRAKARRLRSARQAWRSTTRTRGRSSGACCPAWTSAAGWPPTSIRDLPATNSGAPRRPACVDGQGQRIADAPSSVNHAVWWDADLLREIEDSNWISKWDWNTSSLVRLLTATDAASNNGTKANAGAHGRPVRRLARGSDLAAADNTSLRIYTTTVPADNRIYTLMHDPQYRLGIAWQNVAYNQPPHPELLSRRGHGGPAPAAIVHRDTQPPAFKTLTASATTLWPPNHRMVPVSLDAALVDLLDPAPTARIVGVSSNEPVDGADDGNTSPDWEITGPLSVNLRAERSGTGTGRIYTIQVEGRDAAGNTTLQTVSVSVPVER